MGACLTTEDIQELMPAFGSVVQITGAIMEVHCDLIQSSQDPLEVAKSVQTVVQQLGDLMEVTGGALNLNPSKSYWYLSVSELLGEDKSAWGKS